MHRIGITFLLLLTLFTAAFSQRQFELGIAINDRTFYSSSIALADESFLLIFNHTTKDSSWTELLKINDSGDTLKQSVLRFSGYTINSAGVATTGGCILSVAMAEGCHLKSGNFGFGFVKLDINLKELQRKVVLDPNLTSFPYGPLRFSENRFYCFYYNGLHVFDSSFNLLTSHTGFNHLRSTDFEVIRDKIVCTDYDSTGIELKNLDGITQRFLPRKVVEDVEVYQNEIYVAVDRSILRLDTTFQVLDSLHTHSLGGSIWYPYRLTVYKNQLVAVEHEAFSRYSLPDLQVIFPSYGSFDYGWTFNYFGPFYREQIIANHRSVAGWASSDFLDCSLNNHSWYYSGGFFENSYTGHSRDWPRPTERRVVPDSLWLDTISRYPDYSSSEFNIDVGIHLFNAGTLQATELELYINHNLDTACENPYYSVFDIRALHLQPGEDTVVFFRDIEMFSYKPIDSLYFEVNSKVITVNKKLNTSGKCGHDYVYLITENIITRQRPLPPELPASFSIYPNPTTSELKFDGLMPAGAELRIYNIAGQRVFEQKVEQANPEFTLDVSLLPDAVYLLQIKNSGFKGMYRFVKM